jgi:hypothetical protein
MALIFGVPTAVLLGLLPVSRMWRLAGLWLVWFACLAVQTAYLAHPGRTGFFGIDGMDAVRGRMPVYWASQPVIAAVLLGVMFRVERLRRRRRSFLTPSQEGVGTARGSLDAKAATFEPNGDASPRSVRKLRELDQRARNAVMSTSDDRSAFSRAAAAQQLVDAFNARDDQALRRLYHPDAIVKRPTWPGDSDVEASLESIRLGIGAYPDGRISIRRLIVQNQTAVVEFQFEATNTAPLTLFSGRVVPTGKVLRLGGTIVQAFDDDGLIREDRQYRDVHPLIEVWIGLGVINA